MKTFIYSPPQKGQHRRTVQLITKHSDGSCLVIRTHTSLHTGRIVTRRFWTHKDNLTLPEKSEGAKPKPGVKQEQPSVKNLLKLVAQYHTEKAQQ